MPVQTAVEVEGIDIGHGRHMVEYRLHLSIKTGGMHIILLRHLRQQEPRIVQSGITHGMYQLFKQEGDDAVTGKLYIHNIGSLVNLIPRHGIATPVSIPLPLRHL